MPYPASTVHWVVFTRMEWQQWPKSVIVSMARQHAPKNVADRENPEVSGPWTTVGEYVPSIGEEWTRKTRLLFPEYRCFSSLSERHLLCVGAVIPFPLPAILWCSWKMTEETIAPQKLFSQAQCQMRTGKSGQNYKGWREGKQLTPQICSEGGFV